jgi:hypothetical protein
MTQANNHYLQPYPSNKIPQLHSSNEDITQSVCYYTAVSKFFFVQDVHTGCVNQPSLLLNEHRG